MAGKEGRAVASEGDSNDRILPWGRVRKGGTNPDVSQVKTRPPPPTPMRPAASQGTGSSGPEAGNETKQNG